MIVYKNVRCRANLKKELEQKKEEERQQKDQSRKANPDHERDLQKFRYWLSKSPAEIQAKFKRANKHEQSTWRKQWGSNRNFDFVEKSKEIRKTKDSAHAKEGEYMNKDLGRTRPLNFKECGWMGYGSRHGEHAMLG